MAKHHITYFYNEACKEHSELERRLDEMGLDYRPIPTSGCSMLWLQSSPESPRYVVRGLTNILEMLESLMEEVA